MYATLRATEYAIALTSGDQFLHTAHHTDLFDTTAPTATKTRAREVKGLTQTEFKAINTWSATAADAALQLTALGDVHVWVGLKSRHDRRASFVVRAELLKNGQVIATGESAEITGLTADPTQAKEVTIAFGEITNPTITVGDVLALRILAKVAESSTAKSALGLRVYYDAQSRPARFGATFTTVGGPGDADGDGFTVAQGDCNDTNPAIHPGATELCNGSDDDCDGTVDEGFDVGTACSAGVGACARSGIKICAADGASTVCNATPGSPGPELCGNGIDDNCNGTVDEGFDVGTACNVGVGACARSGVKVCTTNGTGTTCNTTPGPPTAEICNNIDDNCNGQVDDGLGSTTCGQGLCRHTVNNCVAGVPQVCDPFAGAQPEICGNGIDEDCNGADLSCSPKDTQPPSLSITKPTTGSFVIQNQPSIEVSYSDASGINTASLVFTANGTPLTVDCLLNTAGGTCTPTSALPEGLVTLLASVKDSVGNIGSTQIQFTVDSELLGINITVPTNGLVTKDAEVKVMGAVGATVVAVEVNGVSASLSGNSFSATVPLREGTNMLVASGTSVSGKTGTDTVDVTRDLIAPIVHVNSPQDGFVSVNDKITVTGLVNDVVNGGVNPQVRVNGVAATVNGGSFMAMDLPLTRGPNTIEAVAVDAVGNMGRHAITVHFEPLVGARITLASGDGQVGLIGQALPAPLVAVVKDDLGNPVAGRVVQFEVARNSGTLKLDTEDAPKRVVQTPTDGNGRAAVLLTLGDTAGDGNNRVRATALGVAGEVEFCASALAGAPDKILMTMGDNQRGVIGNPLPTPLEVLVVDRDGNPIRNMGVTFTVIKGGGNLNEQQSIMRTTGIDGVARAVFTLGPEPGINNNVVNATFAGLTKLPATFVASGLAPGNPAETRFSGVVLDNGHTPIPGAVVTIDGTTVTDTTDDEGQFFLENVPLGHIHLRIDPANSPRPETFPPLAFETVTVAGQINTLGQPILIPPVDTEGSKIVGGNQEVTLKMKGVTGLELTIFANSVTCPPNAVDRSSDGKQCRVSISQVHLDKVPMPPPSGTIFMPPAWTVQTAGVHFNPPARICIPNDGMAPGRVIDIYQFDHGLNQFINIGKGTTSEDGLIICSDPGFGITAAGWGGCGQPQPPQTCTSSCDDNNRCTDDACANGSCTHTPKTTAQTKANGCEGCNNGTPLPPQTEAQCCASVSFGGGYVVCCNTNKVACVGNGIGNGGNATGGSIVRQCAKKHEEEHFKHVDCPTGADECKTTRPPFKPGQDAGQGECDASKVEVACLQGANCGGDAACQTRVDGRITQIKQYGNTNKAGCFP